MSDLIKIAVDAMGGDGSPKKVIDVIILNNKSNKKMNILNLYIETKHNNEKFLDYFENYTNYLSEITLNSFTKSVSNP